MANAAGAAGTMGVRTTQLMHGAPGAAMHGNNIAGVTKTVQVLTPLQRPLQRPPLQVPRPLHHNLLACGT